MLIPRVPIYIFDVLRHPVLLICAYFLWRRQPNTQICFKTVVGPTAGGGIVTQRRTGMAGKGVELHRICVLGIRESWSLSHSITCICKLPGLKPKTQIFLYTQQRLGFWIPSCPVQTPKSRCSTKEKKPTKREILPLNISRDKASAALCKFVLQVISSLYAPQLSLTSRYASVTV